MALGLGVVAADPRATGRSGHRLGARAVPRRLRPRDGPRHDALLRHHARGHQPADGRLGLRRAEREPAARRHDRRRRAGHGVLRPVRRGRPTGAMADGAGGGRSALVLAARGARRPALPPGPRAVRGRVRRAAIPRTGRSRVRSSQCARRRVADLRSSPAGMRRITASRRSAAGPRTATSPFPCPCSQTTRPPEPHEPLTRLAEPVVGRVQVQRRPVGERGASASAGRAASRPSHSETPSAASARRDLVRQRRGPAPASARCTTDSCTRRRIHQAAGFGPVNVQTGVSARPRRRRRGSPAARSQPATSARRPGPPGAPSATVRMSAGPARSRTIVAAHRSPRPTCGEQLAAASNPGRWAPAWPGRRSRRQLAEQAFSLDESGGVVHDYRPYRANARPRMTRSGSGRNSPMASDEPRVVRARPARALMWWPATAFVLVIVAPDAAAAVHHRSRGRCWSPWVPCCRCSPGACAARGRGPADDRRRSRSSCRRSRSSAPRDPR